MDTRTPRPRGGLIGPGAGIGAGIGLLFGLLSGAEPPIALMLGAAIGLLVGLVFDTLAVSHPGPDEHTE